ncbi:dnaJsubfamily B member 6-A [Dorcoceras hygrometricum]|uniref:DnaJsubfamily B member 6-A n=1 Tax=Dorcoceras hygrometricum TaxID=472368 RepID=A0A2Z7B6Q9_9LAMI|nr:dnaJsubfamily B member 6-A [Dorcoceras hygrometricum]
MADREERSTDFYGVLELKKECTTEELRNAYKKLALKWHPDRCSALGKNSEHVELAKKKFQAIQEAYSDLFMINLPVRNWKLTRRYCLIWNSAFRLQPKEGMVNFLNEMASMMSRHGASDNGNTSFEELQELFNDMFESDIESLTSCSSSFSSAAATPFTSSSPHTIHSDTYCSNKRSSSQMSSDNLKVQATRPERFCPGVNFLPSFLHRLP